MEGSWWVTRGKNANWKTETTMTTTATFGYGRLSDIRGCYTLDLRSYDSVWSDSTWSKCLQDQSSSTFVIRDGSRLVGLVTGSKGVGYYDVHKLAVLPECRRQGHCKRLVEGLGTGELRVTVRETNAVGLAVAKRLGFKAVKMLRNGFDGEDGVMLVRAGLVQNEGVRR